MIRLAVRAPAAQAELVLAELLAIAPSGVEQVDGEGWIEYAVYGAPGELPSLPEGEAVVAGVRVRVSGEPTPDDWAERWKRFHRPVLIADRLYVRPPWEEPAIRPGVLEIVIDPGQAFGTGAHATTALTLELLCGLDASGSFVDLGCGSGVLSIAAAKLGFSPVGAYDADVLAVDATRANARANGVELDAVERFDLRQGPAPSAQTVAANLMRPLLLSLANRFEPPRALVLSGLLGHEADEVAAAFSPLAEERRVLDRGWAALLLCRS
ncbi:MAG: 50S ribosomal protein L11 methyltransferase [Thermoleophilaceae bacterium]|nr:50S ribosomal protein L11 methyltransferase [Thermoleophilaceae bacterium]